MVGFVNHIVFQRFQIDLCGALGVMSHGLADDGDGYLLVVGDGGPGVAADVRAERDVRSQHGGELLQAVVVGAQCLAVLDVGFLRVETVEDGEEVGGAGTVVLADDGLHDGLYLDHDGLAGLAAGIVDMSVTEVGRAEVSQIDKGHPPAGEAEKEEVAGKLQLAYVSVETLMLGGFALMDQTDGNGEMDEALDVIGLDGTFVGLVHAGIDQRKWVVRCQPLAYGPIEKGMQATQVAGGTVAADTLAPKPGLIVQDDVGGKFRERELGPLDAGQIAAETVVGTTVVAGIAQMAGGLHAGDFAEGEGEECAFLLHSCKIVFFLRKTKR